MAVSVPKFHRIRLTGSKQRTRSLARREPQSPCNVRSWRWSQLIDATLYLKRRDGVWPWIKDFIEGCRPSRMASTMVGALTVSNESTVWHASRSRFHALYQA